MTHEQIVQALNSLRPNAEWVLRGDSLEDLEWLDTEQTKPTNKQIKDKIAEYSEE